MGRRDHDHIDPYHCDTRHATLTEERYINFFTPNNTEWASVIIATPGT